MKVNLIKETLGKTRKNNENASVTSYSNSEEANGALERDLWELKQHLNEAKKEMV
jgi:hypothetical protein